MSNKYVYSFSEGNKDMRSLLGGKGANLAEMINLGLSVPQGFTVTTEACNRFLKEGEVLWDSLIDEIDKHIAELEEITGKAFGDVNNPLLVSIRSGAVISMPGMMDTILNLGLNDDSVEGLAKSTDNYHFAYDSYRRFIQMFADVAMEVPKALFDTILDDVKAKEGVERDFEISVDGLKEIVERYKDLYKREVGQDFPQDPKEQMHISTMAVFKSWNNNRAKVYRKLNDIDDNLGTAVNIQSMVFGNMGDRSGTGVAFSRNPATGENELFGEYLMNAQGEDVVAGIRTPSEIHELNKQMPDVYKEFFDTVQKLEHHYKDMQDLEFTIERGKLYILQTRNGKRTAQAGINIAVDLVNEGLITKEEAIMRIKPEDLAQLLHPNFDAKILAESEPLAKGLAASPGAASGKICFHAEDSVRLTANGQRTIIVRQETSPEDIEGMHAAEGILTSRGGMTSHAAVVARGMGKSCVAGASEVYVNEQERTMKIGDKVLHEGDIISIDGSTGCIYEGEIKKVQPELSDNFAVFMEWTDDIRRLGVRANADSPTDAKHALNFGAEGIGLCRTEHMFFKEDRIRHVREMILAQDLEGRIKPLEALLPIQEDDFYNMFKTLGEKPMTVRLLDPPLHEFLPNTEEAMKDLAKDIGTSFEDIKSRVNNLHEVNPMLGHRGCRLAITYPEIYRMQARAIVQAAINVSKELNINIEPEIMIPLVCEVKELIYVKENVIDEVEQVLSENDIRLDYQVGTMLEIPRAALLADQIAEQADFFSFGTNDLTQMCFGFSRDDSGKFLSEYDEKGLLEKSPFESLDQSGVGQLVEIASERGLKGNPDLHLGICGEHGGDPKSIEFFNRVGLDYVSCSPFRVPIARLAAAQSNIDLD